MGDDAETRRLLAALRGIAARETARLRDGTLPWTWWLDHASRYGRYGFTGTLLIAAQWRAATDVRSYEAWRDAGRQVRKGEAGIRIIGADGRLRAVFDLGQTDGLPLGPAPAATAAEVWERLCDVAARLGFATAPGTDVVTLAHQLAHVLRRGDRPDPPGLSGCRGVRRVEADSVAYLVLTGLGLDPPPMNFPEVASWAGPDVGDRVLRLAHRLHDRASDRSPDLMRAAQRFFRSCLDRGWAPGYLADRGFTAGVQRRWRIGYAPDGGQALVARLRALGHPDDAIVGAGLARRAPSGDLYDTFRDRAMFAIRSADGSLAGFIGRRADSAGGPKYLNSPATERFHKGELLYGLHETRDRLARGARAVLVEGPLDAIAINVAAPDAYAAVATCGAALSSAQVAALGGIADLDSAGLLVALDDDPAGRAGSHRAWRTLAEAGVRGPVGMVSFGAGQDPAGLLQEGGRSAVRRALAAERPLADLVLDAAIERSGGTLGTPEARLMAVRAAVRVIAASGGAADAARQVARVADRTGVGAATVTEALTDAVRNGADHRK
ncbi:toprim domain-containing protein [Spirillospora sp. NPDC047279]|uniref:toprim domain-containing protein n=1 Tax=Spirillospora sp. NPDC047279 TaxID=3155478 RepID=UPI0033C2340F